MRATNRGCDCFHSLAQTKNILLAKATAGRGCQGRIREVRGSRESRALAVSGHLRPTHVGPQLRLLRDAPRFSLPLRGRSPAACAAGLSGKRGRAFISCSAKLARRPVLLLLQARACGLLLSPCHLGYSRKTTFEKFLRTLAVRTGSCMELDTRSSGCSQSSAAAGKDSPCSASAFLALRKEGQLLLAQLRGGNGRVWGADSPILVQLGCIVLEKCARHSIFMRSYLF